MAETRQPENRLGLRSVTLRVLGGKAAGPKKNKSVASRNFDQNFKKEQKTDWREKLTTKNIF